MNRVDVGRATRDKICMSRSDIFTCLIQQKARNGCAYNNKYILSSLPIMVFNKSATSNAFIIHIYFMRNIRHQRVRKAKKAREGKRLTKPLTRQPE
jgi:dephospho-CoA kinase